MANDECGQLIGGWTLGSTGECQLKDNGIRVGKGHFTRIIVQHHWNNPTKVTDY